MKLFVFKSTKRERGEGEREREKKESNKLLKVSKTKISLIFYRPTTFVALSQFQNLHQLLSMAETRHFFFSRNRHPEL